MIKQITSLLFVAFCAYTSHLHAQNEDTPNLSFDNGDFSNWTLYTGGYYYDDNAGIYTYDWEETNTTPNIKLMNSVETPDPIVSCSNMNTVPEGASLVARIGIPLEAENMPHSNYCVERAAAYKAMAERMTYTFTVTEKTTLFSYRFATVLHVPEGENAGVHKGGQYPTFSIAVNVVDPISGTEAIMPCGTYEAKADDANSGLTRNSSSCASSEAGNQAGEYVYRNWTSASYDLRNHIGKTVTIDVRTHDCLLDLSASGCSKNIPHITNCAGGHEAYGYIYAQTRKLELISKNCGESDPIIEAPKGFSAYRWYRSDGKPITVPDSEEPWIAIVERASMNDGVTYFCEVSSDMTGCSAITLSTDLESISIHPKFSETDSCSGLIKFQEQTSITGDTISYYKWSFGDGKFSTEKNPKHFYENPGTYDVTLKIISHLGCEDSITQQVIVPYFPKLNIDGKTKLCYGDELVLTVLEAEIGSQFEWSTGNTNQTLRDTAKTSQKYTVKVTDPHSCTYETSIYVSVYPVPEVLVKGDSTVCPNDSVTLTAYNAVKYLWNTGIDSSSITVHPISSSTYTVTGIASNGCKSSKSHKVRVLPTPEISIKGPDEICKGDAVTLTAEGGETYRWNSEKWNNEYDGADLFVSPDSSTRYTVTGIDNNKCASMSTKLIVVKNNPEVRIEGDSIVCQGALIRLNATGATAYKWSNGTEKNSFSTVMDYDITISVEGTSNGCSSKAERFVKMKQAPSVWVDGITDICFNDSLHLIAKGAEKYKWDNGPTTAEMDAQPKISSKYQVTGTGSNGCTSSVLTEVTVFNLPKISTSGDMAVCENTQANLHASGDATIYYWEGSNLGADYSPIVAKDTIFHVEGIDTNGCSNTASIKVKAIPYPTVSITGDSSVCYGTFHNLVAKGAATYLWDNGPSTASFGITPTESMTYNVTGTLNGCSSNASFFVEVLQLPTIWAEGTTEICHGDSLYLVAKGATKYNWGEGTFTDTLRSLPFSTTTYRLTGTDNNNCSNQIDVPITILQKPNISISGEQMVCVNTPANLTASEGCELYVWNNGNSGINIQPVITKKDTFTVIGTDQHGCRNKATITITPIDPPALSILGDTIVCLGKSVTLVGQGASSFMWPDGSTSASYTITPASNMTFLMEGTAQKCTSTKEIHIYTKLPPNILILGDQSICPGDAFSITATGAKEYKWNTGDKKASISYAPQTNTTYTVIGYDSIGCSSQSNYEVTVYSRPKIEIGMSQRAGCLNTKDTVLLEAAGGIFYTWSSTPSWPELAANVNSEKMEIYINEATQIQIKGVDINGCVGYDQIEAKTLPHQEFAFQIEPNLIEPSNPSVIFKGNLPANAEWHWSPELGQDEITGKSIKYSYNTNNIGDSVTVTVRAIDSNGCEYVGEDVVYVWKPFWAPSAFTPNSDEKNEKFRFFGGKHVDDFTFIIYNRLGQIVFEGKSIDDEWDGTYKNEPCPIGVYGWAVQYRSRYKGIDKKGEERGYFSILK